MGSGGAGRVGRIYQRVGEIRGSRESGSLVPEGGGDQGERGEWVTPIVTI